MSQNQNQKNHQNQRNFKPKFGVRGLRFLIILGASLVFLISNLGSRLVLQKFPNAIASQLLFNQMSEDILYQTVSVKQYQPIDSWIGLEQQVLASASIQQWLEQHPDDLETQRFQKLVRLGKSLEKQLTPLGIVRADWKHNVETLAGINIHHRFVSHNTLSTAILSWRTMLPRRAHDEVARIFLKHGAKLWLIRTNQVGGWDEDIAPVAPTVLLGKFGAIAFLPSRIMAAFTTIPSLQNWLFSAAILLIYALIALLIGFYTGFLQLNGFFSKIPAPLAPFSMAKVALINLIFPGLSEELVFRVLLIPHSTEDVSASIWWFWATLSLLLFIIYHPVNALSFFKPGFPTFLHPVFLTLAAFLGIACTIVYAQTGSIFPAIAIHWIVVVIWLLGLGGYQQLNGSLTKSNP